MTPDRWREVDALLSGALGLAEAERDAFLERECAARPGLRAEVMSLLQIQADAESFLEPQTGPTGPEIIQEFEGTSRFVVQGRLGAGGFGVVYRVYDRQQDAAIALKLLPEAAGGPLYDFKREFRALANTVHRNLVMLYELLSEGRQWFFTMELVDGIDFIRYVTTTDAQGRRPDIDRLRASLRQLAEGVNALHAAGILHRDLKPSNVLVESDGRVVILDFGLATEISIGGEEGRIIGTPAYMSPEQAAGLPLSEASDWYSIGVMLYQALTGHLPIVATTREVLALKQQLDIPAASTIAEGIPADLDRLCSDWLSLDPRSRPAGREILERLGAPESAAVFRAPSEAPFVGRERELEELRRAFHVAQGGQASVVYVRGESGTGKSALVGHFLEELKSNDSALVLAGRCYERESVPYKALDHLVDTLAQYLKRLPPPVLRTLTPDDVNALVRLFPVLEQVDFSGGSDQPATAVADLQELRQHAFGAFRELLNRLARRRPVVLFIDDLHWGDADSAALLSALFRPPEAPPLMWIGSYRDREAETSALLRPLLQFRPVWASTVHLTEIPLKDLSDVEGRELASRLLRERLEAAAGAETIAQHAGGNPFFICELVRSLGESGGRGAWSLDRAIHSRVSRLPEEARVLLELVAVAGQPVPLEIVKGAARLETEEEFVLRLLRAAYLVRTRKTEDRLEVETYHDRTREALTESLSPAALQERHRALARQWEASGAADPERLVTHFQGAGERETAARYAVVAAERASAALAFDRAARQYRAALDLAFDRSAERGRLLEGLGDALTNAGRGGEAADAYLGASEGGSRLERLELRRRAAAQLLFSGRIEEGLAVAREVLEALGVRIPGTVTRSLFQFLFWRARIQARGLQVRDRGGRAITAEERLRIDICSTLYLGLSMVDTIGAHQFHARSLLDSLRTNDDYRIARSLLSEVSIYAVRGGRHTRRAQEVLQQAAAIAQRSGHPHAIELAGLEAGVCAFCAGQWKDCRRRMEQAEAGLRRNCTGVAWEIAMARMMGSVSLFFLGEVRLLCERLPVLLEEAESRDDLFQGTDLRSRLSHIPHLAADEPEKAYVEVAKALARWPGQGYHLQHWWALIARTEIHFYSGRDRSAWDELSGEWRQLERTLLMRIQYVRLLSLHHRGCAAVARAGDPDLPLRERKALLKTAEADAQHIERENVPWGNGLGMLVSAGVAARRGDAARACALLAAAERALVPADMPLYAAAARHRRGELSGGDEGLRLIAEADAGMRSQLIREPARMTAMLAPGVELLV